MHDFNIIKNTLNYHTKGRLLWVLLACLLWTGSPGNLSMTWADAPTNRLSDSSQGGQLILSNGTYQEAAVLLNADVQIKVSGLLAQMQFTQTFKNTQDSWMRAQYTFPLPDNATVQGLTLESQGRTVRARIMERKTARDTFENAAAKGQITALVEQQRPNLFSMDVATVAPLSEIKVTLNVMMTVDVDRQFRSMTIPTTYTPRYGNKTSSQSPAIDSVFSTQRQQRGPRLHLTMSIDSLDDHRLVNSNLPNELVASDSSARIHDLPMNQDVQLRWPSEYKDTAQSMLWLSEHNQQRYLQILLNPPAQVAEDAIAPRELILVVDKSGSMAGESIESARRALQFAVDKLDSRDRFNIIAFNDQYEMLFARSQPATDENLRLGHRFVSRLNAGGGTEMHEPLRQALTPDEDFSESHLGQVVFLTDGSVDYEAALLADIKRRIGHKRLFTIGIGSAPNQWFLDKAAETGRGTSLRIVNINRAADAIETLLDDLGKPVVIDVSVQFIGGDGELLPAKPKDLYADKPQLLASRIDSQVESLILSGYQQIDGERVRWQQRLDVPRTASNTSHQHPESPTEGRSTLRGKSHTSDDTSTETDVPVPPIKMFWTRLLIDELLEEQRHSADSEVHEQLITQLAVDAQLLSPYTSFVAVQSEVVRQPNEVLHPTDVASLIPHGNTMLDIDMPQGAAGVDTFAWLSVLSALIGFFFRALHHRRVPLCAP